MKNAIVSIAIAIITAGTIGSPRMLAQARDIPSAGTTAPPGETPEQRGRKLLDEMVTALGGDAWLHRHDVQVKGRTAAFFHGSPTGMIIEYDAWRQFPDGTHPEAE